MPKTDKFKIKGWVESQEVKNNVLEGGSCLHKSELYEINTNICQSDELIYEL